MFERLSVAPSPGWRLRGAYQAQQAPACWGPVQAGGEGVALQLRSRPGLLPSLLVVHGCSYWGGGSRPG